MGDRVYRIRGIDFVPFKYRFLYESVDQSECKRVLEGISGSVVNEFFYFCYKEDLTLTYDKRKMNPKLATEPMYFWNEELLRIFKRHKLAACWRVPVMQGFVAEIKGREYTYLNVSRRSKYMGGTRFNSRGIDQDGNVANYVETEEVFTWGGFAFSHVGVRGSVPIYW
jgi:phosphatidylinositol-bisphosphatase